MKQEASFKTTKVNGRQMRPPTINTIFAVMEEEELFRNLGNGEYRNIVVLTGAGVSTAAGIPDFRSPGGLFDTLRSTFGKRFPFVHDSPETILSRDFALAHVNVYQNEIVPLLQHLGKTTMEVSPTETHRFCAWLARQGWLRRIYTQNVDGLHLHPTLDISEDLVVECHGSVREGNLVLYGDDLPKRFYDCCDMDFSQQIGDATRNASNANAGAPHPPVDLILVFGTSLRVLPFSALPNLAPKNCVRVLINRSLDDCIDYQQCQGESSSSSSSLRIGSRKFVTTKNLWRGREGSKRWRQLLVEGDCDCFVQRFFSSSHFLGTSRRREV